MYLTRSELPRPGVHRVPGTTVLAARHRAVTCHYSSKCKIPAPIQYNQVILSDHLADEDPPPVQTQASLHSGNLLLKLPAIRDRPLSSLRLSSRKRIWFSKISKGSLGEKMQMYTRTPTTSTQTNPVSASRKSLMLKSGLQKRTSFFPLSA